MKKKTNIVLILIIILLTVLCVGLVGYIFYEKSEDMVVDKNIENKNNNNNNSEVMDEEKEVFDNTIRDDLKSKISFLEKLEFQAYERDRYTGWGWKIYKKSVKSIEIDNAEKLYYILKALYPEKRGKSKVTTDFDINSLGEGVEITQVDVSEVEDKFYNLYGNRDISYRNFKEDWTCPIAIYDAKNSKYYLAAECGGTTNVTFKTYISKFTEDKDNYYVYIRVGVLEGPINYGDNSVLYTDYERQNKYKKLTNEELSKIEEIINKDNYQDFSAYKYTFKKNGAKTSYFDSIERLVK